jgi:peroxiredoxin
MLLMDATDSGCRYWAVVIGSIIVGLAALLGVQMTPRTSSSMPSFTLQTFDGQAFRSADLQGQVVVINFWASWCGPCQAEAPALVNAWKTYAGRGVQFLGVTYLDPLPESQAFIQRFGIPYPNGQDEGMIKAFGVELVPTTLVIDRQGMIRARFDTTVGEVELSAQIESALSTVP